MRIKTAWSTLGKILLIVVVTALFVYPFWWMVVNSLNTAAQVFGEMAVDVPVDGTDAAVGVDGDPVHRDTSLLFP